MSLDEVKFELWRLDRSFVADEMRKILEKGHVPFQNHIFENNI